MAEIGKLLIPGVTVSKMRNGRKEIYYVYLPQRFDKYLSYGKWSVTAITNEREILIGLRSIYRHGSYFVLTLPISLRQIWEQYLGKEIDIILEKVA
uniref:Conserved conjugative plasmid protein n=1 Tax=Saccharolobus solfataricus (strain ATCC 35092 / DSM 1617 / JCM 11322 / P2) TaxID=273057 RepID=S6DFC5_SACS2|nr:hypothetical protein [Saccharolobus solfataricus]CDF66448.1 conserved conjugative plasmid protein [Saccharolobus solfataricus P2]